MYTLTNRVPDRITIPAFYINITYADITYTDITYIGITYRGIVAS